MTDSNAAAKGHAVGQTWRLWLLNPTNDIRLLCLSELDFTDEDFFHGVGDYLYNDSLPPMADMSRDLL